MKPVGKRILVKQRKDDGKVGNLYIKNESDHISAEIVSVAEDIDYELSEGTKVLIRNYVGNEVDKKDDDMIYKLINQEHVLAILEDGE